MFMWSWSLTNGILLSLVLVLLNHGSWAVAAPYYKGKTLVLISDQRPGGLGMIRAQVPGRYLQKHLPGRPALVFKYMPGGGGTAAANYMANVVKRDGLTIANCGTGVYPNAIFGSPGVRYKLDDFVFLGSPTPGGPYTLLIRPGLGLDSIEKVKAYKGLRFGQRSIGHSLYIWDRMVAFVLELKNPKWVLGYSAPEIRTAIERGEVDAMTSGLETVIDNNYLTQGFTVPVVYKNLTGRGLESEPRFPRKPYLHDLLDTELKRQVLRLQQSSRPATANFLVPKGIPSEALEALRIAFRKTWADPEFHNEYKRLTGRPPSPVSEAEINKALKEVPKDPKVTQVFKQLIGAGPLPPAK